MCHLQTERESGWVQRDFPRAPWLQNGDLGGFIMWQMLREGFPKKNKLHQSWRMMLHVNVEEFPVKIVIPVFQNPLSL